MKHLTFYEQEQQNYLHVIQENRLDYALSVALEIYRAVRQYLA